MSTVPGPASETANLRLGPARTFLATRAARALADGLVAATFATLVHSRGFDDRTLGWLVTATLLGSAAMLLAVTRRPDVLTPRRVLLLSSVLMVATGLAFSSTGVLLVLVPLAIIGPLNPTGGDVSAFLPAEQALIADVTSDADRSKVFARYSLAGFAGAAVGSLAAGPVAALGTAFGFRSTRGTALAALLYAAVGIVVSIAYVRAGRRDRAIVASPPSRLIESRKRVHELAAVFALDSAGGGFVGTALIAAWLSRRFDFALGQTGLVLALAALASATSSLLAPRLSRRFGLVETMVFTHAPANMLCIAAGFAPNAPLAVGLLIARALLSQLDVPARQTFVMSLVPPAERSAAAAFTNLPRSLAAASTPPIAGWLLFQSRFGWPLILGGGLKLLYDALLFVLFRRHSTKA